MEVHLENTHFSDMISVNEHQLEDNLTVLPIQLTNTTGTYLGHLNEDCLLKVFSSNSLTLMDLCSLAETCTRFEQIIQRVFPKDFGIAHSCFEYKFRGKNVKECYAIVQDAERILKNFGSHLTKLVIWSKDEDLVNLVGMYCGDVTLNHLEISGFKSIEGVKTRMNSIFQRLRQLYVSNCHFVEDVTSQDLNFDSLVVLKIRYSSGCAVILEQTFPNLERFSWHVYTKNSNNGTHLYKFISRHGHLKTINVWDKSVRKNELLHVIDTTCKELKNLELKSFLSSQLSFDFSTQGGLSKLKMLDLEFNYGDRQDIALLEAAKSLETIQLSCSNRWSDERRIFDVLPQLQNLRELHLRFCAINRVPWTMLTRLKKVYLQGPDNDGDFDSAGLLSIIRQLTNLEELEYNYYYHDRSGFFYFRTLRREDFAEIVRIVERREHVLTLKCYCDFKLEGNCYENQKVKLIKRNSGYVDSEN